jgi:hypothetical protein
VLPALLKRMLGVFWEDFWNISWNLDYVLRWEHDYVVLAQFSRIDAEYHVCEQCKREW